MAIIRINSYVCLVPCQTAAMELFYENSPQQKLIFPQKRSAIYV